MPLSPEQLAKMMLELLMTAREMGADLEEVELHLVNDALAARLNGLYMMRPGPTNILSFPGGKDMSGALVLSLDTYAREMALYGQEGKDYLLHLLTHGLAHLTGLAHGPEMDMFTDILEWAWKQKNQS